MYMVIIRTHCLDDELVYGIYEYEVEAEFVMESLIEDMIDAYIYFDDSDFIQELANEEYEDSPFDPYEYF